jgi:hypothetical protein
LATPGLVAGWMLEDPSGTTLADFGPDSLPLTLGANGTLGGTAIIPECAAALTGNGSATGGDVASRAVTAGSPLQFTSGLTFCGWITMGAPLSTGYLGGQANSYEIRQAGSGGVLIGYVWVGGKRKGRGRPHWHHCRSQSIRGTDL